MKKKYTHLFFDLDNTLWDFEQNSRIALQNTLLHFGLNEKGVDFDAFFNSYSIHNSRLWGEYREGKVGKKDLKKLRFEQTFLELGIAGIDPLEMNMQYLTEMPFQTNLVRGTVEILEYLFRKGYFLFIITNGFREVQLKKLDVSGLKKYFSKVYISEEIKAPKPSKTIFEHAIKSSNAKKEASLMIGDDFETDITGALRFGIDAAWLNSADLNLSVENQLFRESEGVYFLNEIIDLKKIL